MTISGITGATPPHVAHPHGKHGPAPAAPAPTSAAPAAPAKADNDGDAGKKQVNLKA